MGINERGTPVLIGGEEHVLLFTTRAAMEIAARFGGMEALGDKLMRTEDAARSLADLVWLLTLLANQSILIHNLSHRENQRELLTDETVELLCSPADLSGYEGAIRDAIEKGMVRNVRSEPGEKNREAG